MKRRLTGVLFVSFCVTLFSFTPLSADSILQPSCTDSSCGSNLQPSQTTQSQSNAAQNPTPLQPADQGLSPQDGSQPSASSAQLTLVGEADHTPPAKNTVALIAAFGGGIVSVAFLLFAADQLFLEGKVLKRLMSKRKIPDEDEGQ